MRAQVFDYRDRVCRQAIDRVQATSQFGISLLLGQ